MESTTGSMSAKGCLAAIALCALALGAGPSLASITETHGLTNSHGLGPGSPPAAGHHFDHYDPASTNSPDTIADRVDFTNGGYAVSKSSAELGALHVYTYAQFPGTTSYSGYSSAAAMAQFADQINPYPNDPLGTFQAFSFKMYIHGIHSIPDWESGGSYTAEAVGRLSVMEPLSGVSSYFDFDSSTMGDGWYFATIMAPAQRTLTLNGRLDALSYVGSNATVAHQALADYWGSAHFYVDSPDPGMNTLALSGHDYAMPVPEPATVSLMILGLAGLVAFARTRKRTDA
jgi:hypothetical protein